MAAHPLSIEIASLSYQAEKLKKLAVTKHSLFHFLYHIILKHACQTHTQCRSGTMHLRCKQKNTTRLGGVGVVRTKGLEPMTSRV